MIEEAIKRLEAAIELKDQGKEAEGDAVVNDMKDWLNGIIEGIEKNVVQEEPLVIERSSLPQAGDVLRITILKTPIAARTRTVEIEQKFKNQITKYQLCVGCHACENACKHNAIKLIKNGPGIL